MRNKKFTFSPLKKTMCNYWLMVIAILKSSFHFQKCLSNCEYLSAKYCFMFSTGASATKSVLMNFCPNF